MEISASQGTEWLNILQKPGKDSSVTVVPTPGDSATHTTTTTTDQSPCLHFLLPGHFWQNDPG